MFGMLPFERSDDNLFDTFDNFTRNFFRGSNASLPAFRTDIRDAGDKFVLEAELPGFDKGDIKLDVKDGILTITAEHNENQEQKDALMAYERTPRVPTSAGSAGTAPSAVPLISPASMKAPLPPLTTTAFWS